jgi:hypothetical protein
MNDVATPAATAPASEPPPPPSAPQSAAGPVGIWLPDRLNPILVRETIQILNGRMFLTLFVLALVGTILAAMLRMSFDEAGQAIGGGVFVSILQFIFLPVVLIYLPYQAFGSMRAELQGGTAELLLLSNLTPTRIVLGRVFATMAQYVLWLSLFAPLIALTYLLRGVSIGDVLLATLVSAVLTLSAAALMTALAAVTRIRMIAALAQVAAGLGLAIAGIATIAAFPDMLMELRDTWRSRGGLEVVSMIALVFAGAIALLLLIAQSQLTHPNENRSTPFRVYLLALLGLGAGWLAVVGRGGLPPDGPAAAAVSGIFVSIPFLLFAATEEERLSPRVRLFVPKHPLLATLVAPLLPGRSRGYLFLVLVVGGLYATFRAVLLPSRAAGVEELEGLADMVALYLVIYGGIGCAVRGLLGPGAARNWLARVVAAALLFLGFSMLPLLMVMAAGEGGAPHWSPLHVLNPFFTIGEFVDDPAPAMPYLIPLAAASIAVNAPAVARGLWETLAAAKARRNAAA